MTIGLNCRLYITIQPYAHVQILRATTSWSYWVGEGLISSGDQNSIIWCDHHLPHAVQHSPLHRVDQVVDCGSSSVAVWSCWILAGTGTRCRIRQSRASQKCAMGYMSGEYAGHARTGIFSAPRNCVQILATWGRSTALTSANRPEQWKPGFICEENTSPTCQTPLNVSICPLKSVTTTNCSQIEVSDSLCRNSLIMQTDCCSSCPGDWSLAGDHAGCGGPGLVWIHVVWGWLDVCQIVWNTFGDGLLNSWATALVDIPAVSMPIAQSLKTCNICGIAVW